MKHDKKDVTISTYCTYMHIQGIAHWMGGGNGHTHEHTLFE